MVATASCPTLACDEKPTRQPTLVGMEWCPMHGMNDDSSREPPSGGSSKHATFGAMGVNDVGLPFLKDASQVAIGVPVANRMDRSL